MPEETQPANQEIDYEEDGASMVPGADGVVNLGHRFCLDLKTPLSLYDHGSSEAYRVFSSQEKEEYLGYICAPHLLPRRADASKYINCDAPGLLPLVDIKKGFFPKLSENRCVVIYKNALGKRLLNPGEEAALAWKYDEVLAFLIKPMLNVLLELRDKGFVHGSIRLSNMYYKNDKKEACLGDCLSLPPSYEQPDIYESIDRSMADPLGRGGGTLEDDIYALGVCVALMLRHTSVSEGMSKNDIIHAKIDRGSYSLLTGRDRFQGAVLEFLRGVLHDSPADRWNIDDILEWAGGARLSPRQPWKQKKAPRPMVFNKKKYYFKSMLAIAFPENPEDLKRVVEQDELNQWVSRALEDEEMGQVIEEALQRVGPRSAKDYGGKLTAYLSCAIDPVAPLRYGDLSTFSDSLGKILFRAMVLGEDVQWIADVIANGAVINWLKYQEGQRIDVAVALSLYDNCRGFIRQSKIGYGLERCLYHLAPDAPCLSEKLRKYLVYSPEGMLRAFEDICTKGAGENASLLLDRHSAAFVAARDHKVIATSLYDLGVPEFHNQVLGNLKVMAAIQEKVKSEKFPAVGQFFAGLMPHILKRFHDRNVRKNMESEVLKYAKIGDLVAMVRAVDNPSLTENDHNGFLATKKEYAGLLIEERQLSASLENDGSFGVVVGKEIAAIVSSCAAGVAILIIALVRFFGDSGSGFY